MSATPTLTSAQLLKATAAALLVAVLILIAAVLPAEYGVDPTGIGRRIGLMALSAAGRPAPPPAADAVLVRRPVPFRNERLTLPLAAGQGIEIKSAMKAGDRFEFSWTSDGGPVEVDFHGERPNDGDRFTSYWAGDAEAAAHGSFVAPFEGVHGWYWKNNGPASVTVNLSVSGYFDRLFVP